jgi:cyanophycin synthetase
MTIEGFRTLLGPNIYTEKPLIGMRLNLGEYAERPSSTLPGFPERLVQRLPALIEHRCSRGYRGGFVERLHEGTYLGHIIEHVALELSEEAGIPEHFGRTVSTETEGVYLVLVAYQNEAGMRRLLEGAVDLVQSVIDDVPFDRERLVEEARQLAAATALGPSTQAIVDAALSRRIPVRQRKDCLLQLGWGKHRQFIEAAMTSATSQIAVDIAADKSLTKEILAEAYVPVPAGEELVHESQLPHVLQRMEFPVVIKPLDGNQGKGVSLNIRSLQEAQMAFRIAQTYSHRVIVEEQFQGKDYRVLIVGYKFVAASHRVPAHVVGDGVSTVAELVERANRDPRRGEGHAKALTKICVDQIAQEQLHRQGLDLGSVPAAEQYVTIRENANLSTGGEAHDVTASVHESVIEICERAARAIGLDVCGIDVVTEDISLPFGRGNGIVEVNAAPGLRMHIAPSVGMPVDVGSAIVATMFPPGSDGRIPTISITGTNGKTTTTRLAAHLLQSTGRRVGMTTTDGIYIGGRCIGVADATGPASAQTVLSDPTVEIAVLETARGGMVRRGMGYDWSDVGVVLNIQPDHIGQDGIRDIEDLIWIKSLVAERVRDGGTVIVNADDTGAMRVLERPRVANRPLQIVLFSLTADNEHVERHLEKGGRAYFVEEGLVWQADGPMRLRLGHVRELLFTYGGVLVHNIANAIAAVAASVAIGMDVAEAWAAACTFSGSSNPGRYELFQCSGRLVMLDYGHNPDAFHAAGALRGLTQKRLIGIVGVPGDRSNEVVFNAARMVAENFDRIIVREDLDLRGRAPGQIPELLLREITRHRPELPVERIDQELAALEHAIETSEPGDLIVIFYERREVLLNKLRTCGAREMESATAADGATEPGLRPVLAGSALERAS